MLKCTLETVLVIDQYTAEYFFVEEVISQKIQLKKILAVNWNSKSVWKSVIR